MSTPEAIPFHIPGTELEVAAKRRLMESLILMMASEEADEDLAHAHIDAFGALLCEWCGMPVLVTVRTVPPEEIEEAKRAQEAHNQGRAGTDPSKFN